MNLSSQQNAESLGVSSTGATEDIANDNFVYEPSPTRNLFGTPPPPPAESFMARQRRKISTRPGPNAQHVVRGEVINRDPGNLESTLSRKTQRKLDRSRIGVRPVVDESTDESLVVTGGPKKEREQKEVEMIEMK
jgi:hypothetical protein